MVVCPAFMDSHIFSRINKLAKKERGITELGQKFYAYYDEYICDCGYSYFRQSKTVDVDKFI